MPTTHINARNEDVAKTVLMPGDPHRAKFIAETFLDDYKLITEVRGAAGYTGTYKGKRVTVMASGMGNPSMGIYSYELYDYYNVDNIIRIGSCGAYTDNIKLYDTILVTKSFSDSAYGVVMSKNKEVIKYSDDELNKKIEATAKKLNIPLVKGCVYSTDVFYRAENNHQWLYSQYECLAGEMESFALFHNAKVLNKKAACLLTVSDSLVTKQRLSPEDREKTLVDMIKIALESVETEET